MADQLDNTVVHLYGVWGETPRRRVTEALEAVRGVRRVRVDVFRAEAAVVHEHACGTRNLVEAVEACGYRAEARGAGPPDEWGSRSEPKGARP